MRTTSALSLHQPFFYNSEGLSISQRVSLLVDAILSLFKLVDFSGIDNHFFTTADYVSVLSISSVSIPKVKKAMPTERKMTQMPSEQ